MIRKIQILILCLLSASFTPVAAGESAMNRFLAMAQGDFQRDLSTAEDGATGFRDRRMQVVVPVLGEHVVYLQINSGEEMKVYRQRLMVLDYDAESNSIRQRAWSLNEPEKFVEAFNKPALFAAIGESDVSRTMSEEGCEQVWTETEEGWYGRVNPDTCRIWSERRQAWRRIEAESKLLPDMLMQAERGFDDEGNQLFGTEPGEYYELLRVSN